MIVALAITLAVLIAAILWALYLYVPGHRYRCKTHGVRYDLITDHPLPALLGGTGTVIGRRVLLAPGVAARLSGVGLAHEVGHVEHRTSWLRYLVDPGYRRREELYAAEYSASRGYTTEFSNAAAQIRWAEARIATTPDEARND